MRESQHKVSQDEKKQGDVAQSKEQNKSPEINSKEVHELPDKEFKITAINELRKTMCEQNENINQEKY